MSDPNEAVDFILKNAETAAKAKSDRVYLDHFLKVKKATLMGESCEKSSVAREEYAMAHPEYLTVIEGIREAVRLEVYSQWQMVAAEARIEIWRTQEATNRRQDRVMR